MLYVEMGTNWIWIRLLARNQAIKIKRGDTYQIKLYLEPGKISDHNRRDNGTLKFTGVASWFIGLFIDVNIDFGDPQGFWTLRVLLPVLAMGICILKAIKNNEEK